MKLQDNKAKLSKRILLGIFRSELKHQEDAKWDVYYNIIVVYYDACLCEM